MKNRTAFFFPIDFKKIIYWGFLGLFLEVMCLIGGAKVSLFSLIFFMIFMGAIEFTGDAVMRGCRLTNGINWIGMSFIIGMVTLSIPMMLITLIIPISALTSFIITFLCLLFLYILLLVRKPFSRLPTFQLRDLLILLILMLIVCFASKTPAGSLVSALAGGKFHAWSDYYIHGITIDSFTNPLSAGQGDPFLVNAPKKFYHYASFVLSAATIPFTGLSGVATATAILLPMGLLIAILGLYALAAELGGRIVAAISVATILCLPEPSMITKVGFFDFYWLLFTAPGSGYAIGIACVACVVLNRFLVSRNQVTGCLSVLLLLSLIGVRAHMFLLMAPPFFYLLFINYFSKQKKAIHVCCLLVAIVTLLLLGLYLPINSFWMGYSRLGEFLSWSLSTSPYYAVIHPFLTSHFSSIELVIELFLILTAALGVFIVIFPILDLIRRHFISQASTKDNLIETLPWLLIISFAALVIFAPAARNGDLSEYKQRAFVLLYPVIVIFSVHSAVKIFMFFKSYKYVSHQIEYGLLLLSLLFVAGWTFTHNPGLPMINEMPWAGTFFDQKLTPGIVEISKYIKMHSKPGDIIAFDSDSSKALNGPVIEIMALTGMHAYLSRVDLFMLSSASEAKNIASDRLKLLTAVENTNDEDLAKKMLRTNGVRWYVSFNKNNPNFDIKGEHHALRSFEVTVYDSAAENKGGVVAKTLVLRNAEEAHIMSQFNGFNVLNWGPQETIQGVIPNLQPDGGAGLWIKCSGGTILGEIKVMLDDKPANATIQTPELVTASIPADSFNVSGEKNIYIRQIATGKIFLIGKLKINPKS